MQDIPNRESPIFNEIDSTPEETGDYHLKLCFCPFCQFGIKSMGLDKKENKKIISWQLLCRSILYSLSVVNAPRVYFSLKKDIYWWIVDHWYCFGSLQQCLLKTSPSKWKKSLLDALSHSSFFESGTVTLKKTGMWRLNQIIAPWEDDKLSSTSLFHPISLPQQPQFLSSLGVLNDFHKSKETIHKDVIFKMPIESTDTNTQNKINTSLHEKSTEDSKENKEIIRSHCIEAIKKYQMAYDELENEMKGNILDNVTIKQLNDIKEVTKMAVSVLNMLDSRQEEQNSILITKVLDKK
ncbi:hypothetical protein KM1_108190 [Entamoeba histolytica HM-3:IMSS]|uniref:Uncharacterized protein n=4 Tax=Entamoeba histolytica TaxID=5759 RepID=C4LW52_ENTH1|nr:hypothetical protein EHI_142070 [Entamoeba histolytica HM-1:IMSS]EAL45382.1 hypothetical protein EHI_142070 [Entamoeba histolytica HM-1:IMSS]EMD45672.1 Hypothetical protein EHI5A_070560 [Entamoeba histolytica KU27]EMS14333.1 hypothetical protein KM1_108190 [Entamoeba histolytica HM-3:IMSS]ENY65047.1 hypothetical protein EHI7A_077260 [Entamoeba histolytica HM-1:IMSS-A]|eukprot:XP_650772.1 hypothetical protein EHI_142070 [Entamoeba histolytica HM-1:IMSS]